MSRQILAKGIDVSAHQGTINWNSVKNSGIKFVMIRAGTGSSTVDANFIKNITGALSVGLNVGTYWFSYAYTVEQAKIEADKYLKTIAPYKDKITMPVCFDWEYVSETYARKHGVIPTKALVSNMALAFLQKVEDAGYYAMNYTNIDCLNRLFDKSVTSRFDTWLASWSKSMPSVPTSFGIWQYGAETNYIDSKYIDGITTIVDKDYMFVDYPAWYAKKRSTITPTVNENKTVDDIKSYAYNDKTQLSKHFNVSEFKCKCGLNHNILISTTLVNKLEELFTTFNCSKIIVNSGYRCANYDKKIGGSSTGQHTKGTAADVTLYDKNNKPIDTKRVCCAAQDLGFTGIANINTAYTSIHLDVRTGSKWYGNEIVNYSTVTSDFYKYFNLTKDNVYKNTSSTVTVDPPTPPMPTVITDNSSSKYNKGTKITLKNVTLYSSATATRGKKISGTYWIYDGVEISGRYRITNSASNVGKTPIGNYVTGFIKKSDI